MVVCRLLEQRCTRYVLEVVRRLKDTKHIGLSSKMKQGGNKIWMHRLNSRIEAYTFGILFRASSHSEMPCLPQDSDELHLGSLYTLMGSTETFHILQKVFHQDDRAERLSRKNCKGGWKKYAIARLHQNCRHFGNMAAPHIMNNYASVQVVQAPYISILSTSLGFICGEELLEIPSTLSFVQIINMSVNRACKECQRQEYHVPIIILPLLTSVGRRYGTTIVMFKICFESDLNLVAMELDRLVTTVVRTARSLIASMPYAKSVKRSVDTKLARAVIELYLFKVRSRIRTGLHRPVRVIMTVPYTTILRRCRPSSNFPENGTPRILEWDQTFKLLSRTRICSTSYALASQSFGKIMTQES